MVIGYLLGLISGIIVAAFGHYLQDLSDKEDRNQEAIYRPLYNEVVDAKDGDFPIVEGSDVYGSADYRSDWENYDAYSDLLIDGQLHQLLDDYVDALDRYDEWHKSGDNARFLDQMPDEVITERNGSAAVVLEGDPDGDGKFTSVRGILAPYRSAIKGAENPSELRREMEAQAARKADTDNGGVFESHLNAFSRWDEDAPGWHEPVWELTRNAPRGDTWWAVQKTPEFFEEVKEKAEELEGALEERINAGFWRGLYYQMRARF